MVHAPVFGSHHADFSCSDYGTVSGAHVLAIFSIISNEALQETIQPIITIAGNTCVQTQMPTVQSTDDTDKILAQSCIMLTAMGGLVK